MISFAWGFLFLLCFGGAGWLLFSYPVRLAQWAESKGIYIPFLELTRSKAGRFQVRAIGLIFFLVSIFLAGVLAFRFLGPGRNQW
jgi:hypothetical protein